MIVPLIFRKRKEPVANLWTTNAANASPIKIVESFVAEKSKG
jgi:hypothetical protein